jgi:hypothetical protein
MQTLIVTLIYGGALFAVGMGFIYKHRREDEAAATASERKAAGLRQSSQLSIDLKQLYSL